MPTRVPSLHEEASAEYDAAFEWYLERSADAALKLDAEVHRGIAEIAQAPTALSAPPPLKGRLIPPGLWYR